MSVLLTNSDYSACSDVVHATQPSLNNLSGILEALLTGILDRFQKPIM